MVSHFLIDREWLRCTQICKHPGAAYKAVPRKRHSHFNDSKGGQGLDMLLCIEKYFFSFNTLSRDREMTFQQFINFLIISLLKY